MKTASAVVCAKMVPRAQQARWEWRGFWQLLPFLGCLLNPALIAADNEARTDRPTATEQTQWKIPSTESFVMRSKHVDAEFEIMVALPQGYSESGVTYPVLYVTDANGAFPIAVQAARFLAFDPNVTAAIIVGIGYPVGLYKNTLPARTRDFTPTPDAEWVTRLGKKYHFSPAGSGGAANFLKFLAEEMIPAVESRYRIDGQRRALYGYSLGGLFAVYALFHQPELFQSYLIGSPALWWDREVAWKYEREFAGAKRDLRVRVYLSAGLADKVHVPLVGKLDGLLRSRQYRGLIWRTDYFPDEIHNSATGLTLSRGLRWLYGDMATASSP